MANRDRTETGEYVETVSEDDVLDVMRTNTAPFVTNGDVAESVGCSTETARRKLTALATAGAIERRKVGANAVVWWIPQLSELDRRAEELWTGEGLSFEEWATDDT